MQAVYAGPEFFNPTPEPAPGAVICPKCGNAMPMGKKFCVKCGARIEAPAPAPAEPAAPTHCRNCGAELFGSKKFCSECGQPVNG